ncbi:MAG: hypothetical protein EOO38_03120 [Cytophagaceae bacterium]|nr:MAG: hypothetical protein EOO38_03120 [Cytophagaceae bacterium]
MVTSIFERTVAIMDPAVEYPLWRGFGKKTFEGLQELGPVRNRMPRNTPLAIHEMCDSWFLENFGIKHRSESLFCTGNRATASHYGNTYQVLPKGDFSFCWSPKIRDLYIEIAFYSNQSEINEFLTRSDFRNDDLQAAVNSHCEIMIYAEGFYVRGDGHDSQRTSTLFK